MFLCTLNYYNFFFKFIHRAFSLIVGILYTCIYILDRYFEYEGPANRTHFLLYQACLDPTSSVSDRTSTYWTFLEFFIIVTFLINISSNIYLYRFLEFQRNKFGKLYLSYQYLVIQMTFRDEKDRH